MRSAYDWTVEELDENGDIVDTNAYPTLAEALRHLPDGKYEIALCKEQADQRGVGDRAYAYIENGKLPTEFDDGSTVPMKYQKEARSASERSGKGA